MTYRYIDADGQESELRDAEELGRAVADGRITAETRFHHGGRWGPAREAPICQAVFAALGPSSEQGEEEDGSTPGRANGSDDPAGEADRVGPRTRQVLATGLFLVLMLVTLATQPRGPLVLLLIVVGLTFGVLTYIWWAGRPGGVFSWRTAWGVSAFGCTVLLSLSVAFANPGQPDLVLGAVGYGIGSGILYGGPVTLFLSGTRLASR